MIASGLRCGLHFLKGSFIPSLVTKLALAMCIWLTSRSVSILFVVQAVDPMANENNDRMKNSIGLDCFFTIGAILAVCLMASNYISGSL